ncbi:A/G-specific adenine glycosylase [Oleiagrimonas sp.]|uniref:A/G-specific adenine glycosylase n=1 Tax=Oleiagrimonas sp. TaxID=2010330 RepID=UPI00262F8E48|nr:A/G-specific adenine glycosylase [Oleiagrimonas sp.]MDA3915129.1 A/G-specific adenine glycosylase [Oleiagrimonas sp.]
MTDPVAPRLLDWYDRHGRKDMPWQHPRSAYNVWLSEVMLQQTRVEAVVDYFLRFVNALPTLEALAAADEDTVLALWSGLGYYRRARFLHRAARLCMREHGGELPRDFDALLALPGIGRSTAGAILAQAYGLRFPILDGNVKRVLARLHGIHGYPGQGAIEKQLWALADSHTPATRLADYTQAIMDLGATLCVRRNPRCPDCPLAHLCVARKKGLTAELPTARPARALPTRSTCMLLLHDARGHVLLERRGPQGVWSGLWSLPEAENAQQAARLARQHAHAVAPLRALESFTHVFSHYRLAIKPLLFETATRSPVVADNDSLRWCGPDQAQALGLPAPVRKLLNIHWETIT